MGVLKISQNYYWNLNIMYQRYKQAGLFSICEYSISIKFTIKLTVVSIVVPVTCNSVLAFCNMVQENATNADFSNYASTFTLLSILSSGFPTFDTPFSVETKTWMFWGSFVNLSIEDVPRFAIQVIATSLTSRLFKYNTFSHYQIRFCTDTLP